MSYVAMTQGSQGSGDMGAAVSTAMGASPIKPPNVASTVDSGLDLNAVQQAVRADTFPSPKLAAEWPTDCDWLTD